MRTLVIATLTMIVGVGLGIGMAVTRVRMAPWDIKTVEDQSAKATASASPTASASADTTAAAPVEPASGKKPKIKIERTEYDFGVIDEDNGAIHSFTIENIGNGVLNLRTQGTSNECLTCKVDQRGFRRARPLGSRLSGAPTKRPT